MPASGEKQMRDTWTMPGELSQISEAVEKGGAATVILEKPVEAVAAQAAEAAPALDFDLDLGAPAAPAVASSAPAAPATAPAAVESAGLDFDLGLDFKPTESKQEPYNPEATVVMGAAKASPPAADLALDIKLDEPAAAPAEEGLHFDLDLGAPATPAAPVQEVVDLEKTIAGGSALDFDFNIGAPAAPQSAAKAEPALDLGAISLDLGEPSKSAEPPAGDEVTTKLELAKAYEEMGDKEGARELLAEVTKEGNAEQQARARDMLAKLG